MSNDMVLVRRTARPRPRIMGILNVTPDSFSDGGRYHSVDDAIAHGVAMHEQGADIIDVGGESTRPGAVRVSPDEEQRRVLPVVRELGDRGIRVSIDTLNSSTARLAAEAGAAVVNDVSGGLADEEMFRTIAALDTEYIVSHWRGHGQNMNDLATYNEVVGDVRTELQRRVAELIVWGVDERRIIIDPGLGFAKTSTHNWKLLGNLDRLESLGYPVLIGASRKRFLADLLPGDAEPTDRDPATAVIGALAAQAGVWGVRVHDVETTKAALAVWTAWEKGATE
ncbi:dihydropteroate synthase [Conyzicola nivalis]|uniref:Dihydropteroate synthase n=1 Tax=Conyzicola nivalis TaxID=1477021 RepID=A0A916SQ33_9MICO|nr:dihydropteroate synthase [Conyzicola nivalis]GGB10613.1 dihydropteroate synthase [Conyzicola nivalis]